jgi:hypothetical protein
MDGTYNSGMSTGVRPFQQSTRTGEFTSGMVNSSKSGSALNIQQIYGGYQPPSVLSPLPTRPNGQSANTFEANRALNYYRQ